MTISQPGSYRLSGNLVVPDAHTSGIVITGEGILLDVSGGVASGNIASFNGDQGIRAPNGTVIGNTAVRNVAFGILSVCPSSIANNTVVSNTSGSIETSGAGCILANNAVR